QSGRAGRAMLGALGLQQYSELFDGAPGPVYLEAMIGERLVPIFRWSNGGGGPLANTPATGLGPPDRLDTWEEGTYWDAQESIWWLWKGFRSEPVGSFVLTMKVNSTCPTAEDELTASRDLLQRAADAMTLGK